MLIKKKVPDVSGLMITTVLNTNLEMRAKFLITMYTLQLKN